MNIRHLVTCLLILTACVYPRALKAQTTLIDQGPVGWIPDHHAGTTIDSLAQLPKNIQKVVQGILLARLPAYFSDKLTFVQGKHIDLDAYLKYDPVVPDRASWDPYPEQVECRWVVPAYDLRFIYSDTARGILKYNVEFRLDDYGQVLELNLPNRNQKYLSKESYPPLPEMFKKFKKEYVIQPLAEAVEIASRAAKKSGYKTDSCEVKLRYENNDDCLYWIVTFTHQVKDHSPLYHVYHLEATTLKIE